jgi:hypothetical protein
MNETQRKIDYNKKQILWLEKRLNNPRVSKNYSDYDIRDGLKKLLVDYKMDNERLEKDFTEKYKVSA